LLSARVIASPERIEGAQTCEILRSATRVGEMEIYNRCSGKIILESYVCKVGTPSNEEERIACREAIDFATGGGRDSPSMDTAPLLLFDSFDRLLAVAERLRKSTRLHWGENSCYFKSTSLFALVSRWMLVSTSDGVGRGWVGRRSSSKELIELELEIEMSEPVQAFTLWLAARQLSESVA
jgi:hypothetical protein